MSRLTEIFSDVETAAEFLSMYFSSDNDGVACYKCPVRFECKQNWLGMEHVDCEERIADWLEGGF